MKLMTVYQLGGGVDNSRKTKRKRPNVWNEDVNGFDRFAIKYIIDDFLFRIKYGADLQKGYCRCITMPGNSYWEEDPVMENVTDNAIINLGEYFSSDEDSNDGESSSGTDTKHIKSFMSDFISL